MRTPDARSRVSVSAVFRLPFQRALLVFTLVRSAAPPSKQSGEQRVRQIERWKRLERRLLHKAVVELAECVGNLVLFDVPGESGSAPAAERRAQDAGCRFERSVFREISGRLTAERGAMTRVASFSVSLGKSLAKAFAPSSSGSSNADPYSPTVWTTRPGPVFGS